MAAQEVKRAEYVQTLKDAFALFDVDKNGVLDKTEMRSILQAGDGPEPMTDAAFETLFAAIDADSSGGVSIDEFINYCSAREFGEVAVAADALDLNAAIASEGTSAQRRSQAVYGQQRR